MVFVILLGALFHTARADDFELVVNRYRELLLQEAAPDPASTREWTVGMGADGRWPDINYADPKLSGWDASRHLDRLRGLCLVLSRQESADPAAAGLESSVFRGLDHWIARRYQNENWWHNEIGVPQMIRDIVVLLGSRLEGERRKGALEVFRQYREPKRGDGANTIWEAQLALLYGAITRDARKVGDASRTISGEIRVSTGEGIQPDASYHQHHARLQQFHYGASYFQDTARLVWLLRGTDWAISQEKPAILADAVLRGSQWMVRGTSTVPGTLDRSVCRPGAMAKGDLRKIASKLREAVPDRAGELDALIERQDGKGSPLLGFRAFPRSDFVVYQRPGFGFFLKLRSTRTLGTESINGENRKGRFLNWGDHYLLADGAEYFRLPPVWNWDLLPGVTLVEKPEVPRPGNFAGALGDGQSGMATMIYQSGGKGTPPVEIRKSWVCHDDRIVCLTEGLPEGTTTRTALDQCQLRGAVTMGLPGGGQEVIPTGDHPARTLEWVHHASFVYLPLDGATLSLRSGVFKGAWRDISIAGSTDVNEEPVFLPVLCSKEKTAGYFMAFAESPAAAAKIVAKPGFRVLRNDRSMQLVSWEDGAWFAVFFAGGEVTEGEFQVSVDQPCLVMRNAAGDIWMCDPAQSGGDRKTRINGTEFVVELPADGTSVKLSE